MIICGIPENSICRANEHRWKTLSNASQEKHLAVSALRRSLYPVGRFYLGVLGRYSGLQYSLSGFLETKNSKCGAMPIRIASCKQVIFGSIAKTFCSIHENSQTVFFFWKVTRPYSFVNNKLSFSARKQMLLLCFFNTVSRWKPWTKRGKSAK